MDAVYYLAGILITVGLPVVIGFTIVSILNPSFLNKLKLVKHPASRLQIIVVSVLLLTLSGYGLLTVRAVTEPANVKQARLVEEAAVKKAEIELEREEQRLAEIEAAKPKVTIETETEDIPYKSVTQNDNSIDKGTSKVSTVGSNGVRTITYEVMTVKGKIINRKKIKNEITVSPVNQVTSVGTYVKPTTCVDVTSYDYNWNNDMLCTRGDGSSFYTDYEGASQYGS